MQQKYDIIYSIGRDCGCATYLLMNRLRSFAGPFDWLTNAGFETRFELMLNDFNDFMNISDIKFLPKDSNVFNDPNCDYYENIKTGFFYYHDFPQNIPLEESFRRIKEKYDRRIKRFYEKIKKSNKVLLVWFSHYNTTADEVVLDLCNKFCQKMGKRIDFLIIEHEDGCYKPIEKILAENIVRYKLHSIMLDENNNPTTLGNTELCNVIFRKFKLKISTYMKGLLFRIGNRLCFYASAIKKKLQKD